MQACKMKGTIDGDGQLITAPQAETPKRQRPSQIKALKDWFSETEPASPDFDPDMARWEALKQKHNL